MIGCRAGGSGEFAGQAQAAGGRAQLTGKRTQLFFYLYFFGHCAKIIYTF